MDCCDWFIKWILYIFNVLCLIAGILLIVLGAVILSGMGDLKSVSNVVTTDTIPIMVIVLGCVIFLISFFGCCGAIKEINWCMMMYSIFMFVLMCLQIALVVWVFVKRDEFLNAMSDIVQKAWETNNGASDSPMNIIQVTFKCCGNTSPLNYGVTPVPSTCCGSYNLQTSCPITTYLTKPGCESAFYNFWDSNLKYVRYGGIVVAVIEFIIVIFSCVLSAAIRRKGN